jgi:hypothetical protein
MENGLPFLIQVSKDGFTNPNLSFYHLPSDCSGTRYFISDFDNQCPIPCGTVPGPTPLVRANRASGGKIVYPTDPLLPYDVSLFGSEEFIPAGSDPSLPGQCGPNPFDSPVQVKAGIAGIIDLTGLTPPFHVQQ